MVIEMEKILFNMIIIIFPILMYLVFSCYNSLTNKKIKKLIFILTICTSLYLGLKYMELKRLLLFCNIPVLICYFKKEGLLGIILSFIVIMYSYFIYDVNIYITVLKYLCYFVIYIKLKEKGNFHYLFFRITAIVQAFFISFEYFIDDYTYFSELLELIFYVFVIYVLTFLALDLFKLAIEISSLYSVTNKIKEENKLKESLFKLTHEIKNPLAVCKGYINMINLEEIDKSNKYINIIKSEIDRSLNVMADFMEYSKIKINKDILDITMLLDDIYDSFNILIRDKKITFNYHNKYDEIYLLGDYERLKQVFVNVIKNSIESIDKNGIIDIDISLMKKDVIITIKDNGIGMTKEEIKNMKEMFYTTKKDGTGLGVALSNEIIEAHNGKMTYQSEKNKGTTCIVRLPI